MFSISHLIKTKSYGCVFECPNWAGTSFKRPNKMTTFRELTADTNCERSLVCACVRACINVNMPQARKTGKRESNVEIVVFLLSLFVDIVFSHSLSLSLKFYCTRNFLVSFVFGAQCFECEGFLFQFDAWWHQFRYHIKSMKINGSHYFSAKSI